MYCPCLLDKHNKMDEIILDFGRRLRRCRILTFFFYLRSKPDETSRTNFLLKINRSESKIKTIDIMDFPFPGTLIDKNFTSDAFKLSSTYLSKRVWMVWCVSDYFAVHLFLTKFSISNYILLPHLKQPFCDCDLMCAVYVYCV